MTMADEIITDPFPGEPLAKNEGARPDWEMPAAPECDVCGFDEETDEHTDPVVTLPAAHLEDAWALFWSCPRCDEEEFDGLEIDWPFRIDEYANADDLKKLGFKVIE